MEPIRLVIWDLDETFWRGTLAEEGIREFVQEHHDLVIELARRGIMSSICSKNDFRNVKGILEAQKIWEYFVFPSIDWSPKGARIASIVEASQLRPATILFIDDNHGNRAEAQAAVPGVEVADETFIHEMRDHPLFRGKDDREFTRLRQYKLLEERATAQSKFTGDNRTFLAQSGIKVRIIDDIEDKLDRVIEIINRTNQLNFTKQRLPSDAEESKAIIRKALAVYFTRAGLVEVEDRYGKYGYCGFFMISGVWGKISVSHFAFSCRVLGMGVEQWVYDIIGRPEFEIVGEVLSKLDFTPDWINKNDTREKSSEDDYVISDIRIRGGCELEIIEHYFRANAVKVSSEFVSIRGLHVIASHNTAMLANALRGFDETQVQSLSALGYEPTELQTKFFTEAKTGSLHIYSPSGDSSIPLYRHKQSGMKIALNFVDFGIPYGKSPSEIDEFVYSKISTEAEKAAFYRALDELEARYELVTEGWETVLNDDYKLILNSVPQTSLLVVLLPSNVYQTDGKIETHSLLTHNNSMFKSCVGAESNIFFVETSELLDVKTQIPELLHYTRSGYRKIYQHVSEVYRKWLRSSGLASAAR